MPAEEIAVEVLTAVAAARTGADQIGMRAEAFELHGPY
jgi:hypothetical protein